MFDHQPFALLVDEPDRLRILLDAALVSDLNHGRRQDQRADLVVDRGRRVQGGAQHRRHRLVGLQQLVERHGSALVARQHALPVRILDLGKVGIDVDRRGRAFVPDRDGFLELGGSPCDVGVVVGHVLVGQQLPLNFRGRCERTFPAGNGNRRRACAGRARTS